MQPQIDVNDLPIRSRLITREEFIELTDSTPERIEPLEHRLRVLQDG